jgi:hypothetical protein
MRHGHNDHLRPPARQQRGLFFDGMSLPFAGAGEFTHAFFWLAATT